MNTQYASAAVALDGLIADGVTLAERLRAYGTEIAEGKDTHEFDGHHYVMERGLPVDVALIKAEVADTVGDLRFAKTARNFNPLAATAGRVCVAEVERLVPAGEIGPDDIHLPSIYVDRIVVNAAPEKRIEKRTVSEAAHA